MMLPKQHALLAYACDMYVNRLYQETDPNHFKSLSDSHNNEVVQYILGEYFYRKSVEAENTKDRENFRKKAWHHFRLSANLDLPEAWLGLARLLHEQKGNDQTRRKTVFQYTWNACESEYPEAFYQMGRLLQDGYGCRENPTKAARFYRRAVKYKHSLAAFALAMLYLSGRIGKKDNAAAAFRYPMPEEFELFGGLPLLAYRPRAGTPSNYRQAEKLLKIASGLGMEVADAFLGILYDEDDSPIRNPYFALKHYKRVERTSCGSFPEICARLGAIYLFGRGIPRDFRKAKYYFNRYQDDRAGQSSCYLGMMYEHAWGCRRNLVRAMELYKESLLEPTEAPEGHCALARFHMQENTEAYNPGKALFHIRKALNFCFPEAEFLAGIALENFQCKQEWGQTAGADCILAQEGKSVDPFFWFARSAEHGYPPAMFRFSVRDHTLSAQSAAQWMIRAADCGFAAAQLAVGMMYRNGHDGVDCDLVKAYFYLMQGSRDPLRLRWSLECAMERTDAVDQLLRFAEFQAADLRKQIKTPEGRRLLRSLKRRKRFL